MTKLTVTHESWPMIRPFRIAYRTMSSVDMVVVTLEQDGFVGRGEGLEVVYKDETVDVMIRQIEGRRDVIEAGVSRDALYDHLPAGGARNAVDCALWDLECKRSGRTIWQRLDLAPRRLHTVYTIGIDTPESMARNARTSTEATLKVKINAEAPVEQVAAVRGARPDARLIVDANQAFDLSELPGLISDLEPLGVEMIEQPLKVGADSDLEGFHSSIPLAADESCQTSADAAYVAARYQIANIKLDKTGGLTEALKLRDACQAAGLELMVGCMAGTSLAMAPAYVIGQSCRYVDIDGPLLQTADRDHALVYEAGDVSIPTPQLWG